MEASQNVTARWPRLPSQVPQRSHGKDSSHQRPGLTRRVKSWSESISNRSMWSTPKSGHKRNMSTIQDQKIPPRPASPDRLISPGGHQAPTTQTSKTKKSRTAEGGIYHPSMAIINEDEFHIPAHPEKNNENPYKRLLFVTKRTSRNSLCNSSATNSSQNAELTSKGSNSAHGKHAQSRVENELQPLENNPLNTRHPSSELLLDIKYPDGSDHDLRTKRMSKLTLSAAKLLKSIFQDVDSLSESRSISNNDVRELLGVADFMFAAQSYHDSFRICHKLWSLVGPITVDNQPSNSPKPEPLWLVIAANMVRSAQTPEDYSVVARMMKNMPNRSEWPEYYKTNDYCMLYAFLSNICLDLADLPQAEKACLESWKHCQTLITKRPLVQYVLSTLVDDLRLVRITRSATDYVGQRVVAQFKRRMTVDAGVPLTARDLNFSLPFLNPNIDQHVQGVLTWCVTSMSQQEIFFLISNIDVAFWSHEIDDHDVREFERRVVFCYLSERLRHCERSQKTNLAGKGLQDGILWSFGEIHDQSGISKMDILTAVTKALSIEDTTQRIDRSRATLPERYLQLIESLRKDMIIHNAGYARTGQRLTSQTLFDYYEWPGKSGHHSEQYHSQNYGRCVEIFLREFMVISHESDLTERLGQAFKCRANVKSSRDKTHLPKVVESVEWGDDYRAFEVVARDICGDAALISNKHLRGPSYASEEWISQRPSGQVLFRCSNLMHELGASNPPVKQEKQAFKTRNKGGTGGSTFVLGSIDTSASSMLNFE